MKEEVEDNLPQEEEMTEELPDGAVKITLINQSMSTFRDAIYWSGVAGCAYFIYRIIATLSGKQTWAMIDIGVDVNTPSGGLLVFSAFINIFLLGLVYYYKIRCDAHDEIRRDNIERFSSRLKEFEKGEYPGRTSSGLDERGEERTRIEDGD